MGKKYNIVFNSLDDDVIHINGLNTTSSRLQYNINWASFLPKNEGKRFRCTFSFKSYAENDLMINDNIMISMNLGKNYIFQNSRQSNIIGTVGSVSNGGAPSVIVGRGILSQTGTTATITNLQGFISNGSILKTSNTGATTTIMDFISGRRSADGVYRTISSLEIQNAPFYAVNGVSSYYSCTESDNPSFEIEYPQINEVIIEIRNFNNHLLKQTDYVAPLNMYFTLVYVLILQLEEI